MGTIEFLDRVKAAHSLPSDYALAPVLGLTKSQVSQYRNGKSFIGDATALKVAELLDLEPAYVLACIHAERTTDEALRSVWSRLAAQMAGAAHHAVLAMIAVILSAGVTASPDASAMAKAASPAATEQGMYIM